jgi:hypothetical protein
MESEEKEDISVLSIFFYGLSLCSGLYVMIVKLLTLFYLIRSIFSSLNSLKDVVTFFVIFVAISVVLIPMFILPFWVIGIIIKLTQNTQESPKAVTKPFQKYHITTHNINFSFNQFTYTDSNETQSFQLASIDKIVLFGNNSQNKSLNIYYDKDKIYTFYSDMKDWKALLERLNAHFSLKIDAKTANNKQVLYERKS